jgi:hypothetical protein
MVLEKMSTHRDMGQKYNKYYTSTDLDCSAKDTESKISQLNQ